MAITTTTSAPRRSPTPDPDATLVSRAVTGDGAAVERLVARHYAWAYRLSLARLRHRQDAEDATQEALLRAVNGLQRFQGRSTFRTWLATIVERECVDVARRRSRHAVSPELAAALATFQRQHAPDSGPEEAPVGPLRDAVAALGVDQRNVIALRFYRGRGMDEVASTLGVGLSAAKMRLYRSLDQVRAHLAAEGLRHLA